jgi:hypothetical protein
MTAQLILDDPAWNYPAPAGGTANRRLRVYRTGPGRVSALLTEAGTGPNIGVCVVAIAEKLASEWPDDILSQLQHWPATGRRDGHFVSVDIPDVGDPRWNYLTAAQVADRLGSVAVHDVP